MQIFRDRRFHSSEMAINLDKGRSAIIRNAHGIAKQRDTDPTLLSIMDWIHSYVSRPHPELGRSGVVCPYVPPSLRIGSLWIAVVDNEAPISSVNEICEILRRFLIAYESLEPLEGESLELKALIIVMDSIPVAMSGDLVRRAHAVMKPEVVNKGLMLGEFFPGNRSPGLHNPAFFPLMSPMPLFIFRQMVINDVAFLNKASDPPALRVGFLTSYLSRFANKLPEEKRTEAAHALERAQFEVGSEMSADRSG